MTVDLRNTDETMLQQAEQALNAFLATLAKEKASPSPRAAWPASSRWCSMPG